MSIRWLSADVVIALHEESLAAFGGAPGIRDRALLESALARPRNLKAYGRGVREFELAARLCHGVIRNHPFVDGNKRAGLLAARAFLYLNGYLLEPDEADEVAVILGVAAGEVDESSLSRWLRAASMQRPR